MNLTEKMKPGRLSTGLLCVLREEGRLENSSRVLNGDLKIKGMIDKKQKPNITLISAGPKYRSCFL